MKIFQFPNCSFTTLQRFPNGAQIGSEVRLISLGMGMGPMGIDRSKTDLKFKDPHFEPFTFGKIVSSYAGYIWLDYKVYIYTTYKF